MSNDLSKYFSDHFKKLGKDLTSGKKVEGAAVIGRGNDATSSEVVNKPQADSLIDNTKSYKPGEYKKESGLDWKKGLAAFGEGLAKEQKPIPQARMKHSTFKPEDVMAVRRRALMDVIKGR